MMYKPLQIPNLHNKSYLENISYTETIIPELSDYLICMWESYSYVEVTGMMTTVIVTDACIDLVIDITNQNIGYQGMVKTNFNFKSTMPEKSIGFRFKPGAFFALTGMEATAAMGRYLPLETIDDHFDRVSFFKMDDESMKNFLLEYLKKLVENARDTKYIRLFDDINNKTFIKAEQLYEFINLKPRQTQRLFKKHYGLSPKVILTIIRFQHCLRELVKDTAENDNILINYYDQSHFINDFKENIGVTPTEFMSLIKK